MPRWSTLTVSHSGDKTVCARKTNENEHTHVVQIVQSAKEPHILINTRENGNFMQKSTGNYV